MRRFQYACDPLFLIGCVAYCVNRWLVKPRMHSIFLHSYFNDLWLIPCALPLILWLHRRMHIRTHDEMPRLSEVVFHLVLWSLICEWIGPTLVPGKTGDLWDVAAYSVGAGFAYVWWHHAQIFRFVKP